MVRKTTLLQDFEGTRETNYVLIQAVLRHIKQQNKSKKPKQSTKLFCTNFLENE